MLAPEPIECSGDAENAEEALGGFLVSGRDSPLLLQPRPEPCDLVAVVAHPFGAGYGRLMALRRDRGSGAPIPDVLTEGVAGGATVGHDL